MSDHLPAFLLLLPLMGAWVTLAVHFISHRLSHWAAGGTLLLTFVTLIKVLSRLLAQGTWHYSLGGWAPPWGIELVVTPFSAFFAVLLLLTATFAFFYLGSHGLLSGLPKVRESLGDSLLLVFVGGLFGLLWVSDSFTFYLFLQAVLATAAALMACWNRQVGMGVFHFLLFGSAGASLFLAGSLILYASTGTLNLGDLLAQLFIFKNYTLILVAGSLIALGWTLPLFFPSVRAFPALLTQTSPFLLGLFSSTLARVGAFSLFVFFFFVLGVPGLDQPLWLLFIGYVLTYLVFYEFLTAARQKDVLQTVSYLSVAQLGYLFAGFLLGNKSALTGALMELSTQVLVVAGLFFVAGSLQSGAGSLPFTRMMGLARHRPLTGLALVIFAAAIVGVPPTGGFFGKWYLVLGAYEKRDWVLLAGILATVAFNFVYFFKLTLFLYEHRASSFSKAPVSLLFKAPILVLAAGVLLLGIFHVELFHHFIEPALPKVFQNLQVPNVPFLGKQVE